MSERKLARVVMIDDVQTHPNADALELAVVGGWQCCVKKDEFKEGDLAVYFEIDSMLPLDNPDFAFLEGRNQYERDGRQYSRIKTIKLRKELSQGLLVPYKGTLRDVGKDMTEFYGVIKYEAPEERISNGGGGNIKRLREFPSFIPKTDQERVQNCVRQYNEAVAAGMEFEVTFKLDGSSFTAYVKDGKFGCCSRNIELQIAPIEWNLLEQVKNYWSEFKRFNRRALKTGRITFPEWKKGVDPEDNHFTQMFHKLSLDTRLTGFGKNVAIQGELVGPNIQSNFEGVTENALYIYSVYLIDEKRYMLPDEARAEVQRVGLNYVPVLWERATLPATVADVLALADGPSGLNGKFREGLVFKSLTTDFSFKVISNQYLLKTGK